MYMQGNDGVAWEWCAGFCFFILSQSCALLHDDMPINTTFSVDTVVDRAKTAHQFVTEQKVQGAPDKSKVVPPRSFFVVRRTPTAWSHVGIASHADADTYGTCEGNTNDDGSSNG
jgi:hypothetical protein